MGAPVERQIEADAEERTALAKTFGLPAIAKLTGEFTLVHERGGIIEAKLALQARVTQVCVVSLEPFEAKVAENAILRFVPAASVRETEDIAGLDLETPETLEGPDEVPYANGIIDLGATLAEQLALALDPYPRKPGAKLPAGITSESANPFAVLAVRKALPANDEG